MMKKSSGLIMILLILLASMSTALGAGFDISLFEKDAGLYSVYIEDGDAFIEVNLSAEEKDFSHKYNSEYYYNSIYPNIIVLRQGTTEEIAIPRVWIYYRTENKALSVKEVEFSIYNSKFSFSIDDSNISALEKGTISEELVILIDENCIEEFFWNWCYAASENKPIEVKLIGATETIKFEVPLDVANAGMQLFLTYAQGLKKASASVLDYSGTPVTVSERYARASAENDMVYRDAINGTSLSIPDGWTVVENRNDGNTVYAKIRWESEDRNKHANIRYQAYDLYGEMINLGYSEKEIGGKRTDINSTYISKVDMAEMLGKPVSEIEYIRYGDYEYYSTIENYSETMNNIEVSVTLKRYVHIHNGVMYSFSFAGEESKFRDFEMLLSSVKHDN